MLVMSTFINFLITFHRLDPFQVIHTILRVNLSLTLDVAIFYLTKLKLDTLCENLFTSFKYSSSRFQLTANSSNFKGIIVQWVKRVLGGEWKEDLVDTC